MRVALVALVYHDADLFAKMLASVRCGISQPDDAIVVVCNAEDETRLKADGGVRVVRMFGNEGTGAAFSLGMKVALKRGADWVWLMDSDGTATGGTLCAFRSLYENRYCGDIGIVVPRTYSMINGHQEDTTKAYRTGWYGRQWALYGCGNPVHADLAGGNGLFIHGACIRDVGGYDPRFFFGYDDTEFTLRVKKAGWGIIHDPRIVVWHPAKLAKGRLWWFKAWVISWLPPIFRDLRRNAGRYNVRVKPAALRHAMYLAPWQWWAVFCYSTVVVALKAGVECVLGVERRSMFADSVRTWLWCWGERNERADIH